MCEQPLPTGWKQSNLASIGEYFNGFPFSEQHWSDHGLPIIRIAQITGSQGIEDRFSGILPNIYRLQNEDLIFSWSGTLTVVRWQGGPAWLNQHLFRVLPGTRINKNFLFYVLKSSVEEMNKRSHGSTMKHIKRGELSEFIVKIPEDEAEQSKIAAILDTLDTAIQRTEVIIEKLKQVKQGLLHDLLTRGIDTNGELRPTPTESPKLYKNSPIGLIPKEWEVIAIKDIARRSGGVLQTGPFGAQLHAHEYVNQGVPVIMPQDMVGNILRETKIARITERKAQSLLRHRLANNDVVFSRRGDLSLCVSISNQESGWVCGTGCLLARLPESEVLGSWLSTIYRQPCLQSQVMGRAVGSTMANLNTAILGELIIPRPKPSEQNAIDKRLSASDSNIKDETTNLAKLNKFKSGLMDDLLTGKVRVTDLLTTSPK